MDSNASTGATARELRDLVIVGGGMAAHRLVEAVMDRDTERNWRITVLAEEPRAPYDRVGLTSYFTHFDPDSLTLGSAEMWRDPHVSLRLNAQVTRIDRVGRFVELGDGRQIDYDALVLATGSSAFVPAILGRDLPGTFVYRTLEDVAALRDWVAERAKVNADVRGAVVGGGLLGLEAAGALRALGVQTTVVEFAPRLMAQQVDAGGGEALRRLIENLNIDVRTGTATAGLRADPAGLVGGMDFEDGTSIEVDVVVSWSTKRAGLRIHASGPSARWRASMGARLVWSPPRTPWQRSWRTV
jgi:nitrite reductase (NADH) large subunit